jgi:SAM-dependent methyltransferase
MLHQARSALLREMPSGSKRLLSAGCNGRWYFDWIERCYGHVQEHIGLEFHLPQPDSLPQNVKWIANTASDMSEVPSETCDIVFSGQNLEHLWPEEAAGFLVEAARVLRPGGYIVLDSPNRALTEALNWSNPEHTVELTVDEVTELLTLAGFEVTKSAGIWLCRDPKTARVLPFDPNEPDPDWSVTERLIAAYGSPHQSFIWWLEGRRTSHAPQRQAVEETLKELFRGHWPERIQRLVASPSRLSEHRDGADWVIARAGEAGLVFNGPGVPLRAGRYRCAFKLKPDTKADESYAVCDIVAGIHEPETLARCEVAAGQTGATLEFTLDKLHFGIQFRCSSLGRIGFSACRRIALQEEFW